MDALTAAQRLLKLCRVYVNGYGWAYGYCGYETKPAAGDAGNLFAAGAPGGSVSEDFTSLPDYREGVNVWTALRLAIREAYVWAEPALKDSGWKLDVPLIDHGSPYAELVDRLGHFPQEDAETMETAWGIYQEMEAEFETLRRCVDALARKAIRGELNNNADKSTGPITIEQMATLARISRSKLESKRDDRPAATVKPGGSAPSQFDYHELRQWVLKHFADRAFHLPEGYKTACDSLAQMSN